MRLRLLGRYRHTCSALALCAAFTATAVAQETGTPVPSAPFRIFSHYEIGASVSAPEGADLGLEGFFGFASGRHDWSLRVGFVDRGRGTDLLVGGRYRTPLVRHSADFPLDLGLTVGLGADFTDETGELRIPVGVSLGRRLGGASSGVTLLPYVQPLLVPRFGDAGSELEAALGLGLDLRLGRHLDLRLGGMVGDREGFSVSLAWVD